MKKLFVFFIASILASAGFSQKIDGTQVPDAVLQTLKTRYNNTKDLVWEKADSEFTLQLS